MVRQELGLGLELGRRDSLPGDRLRLVAADSWRQPGKCARCLMMNGGDEDSGRSAPARNNICAWITATLIIVLCISQLFVALSVIPRFEVIYHDMYGGKPLGTLTTFVIRGRWILAALACFCLTAALILVRRPAWSGLLGAVLWFIIGQLFLTVLALFLPLVVIIQAQEPNQ